MEPRRQFELPDFDREHLECLGCVWETIVDGGKRWLLVHRYPIPSGYNVGEANLGLQIEPNYPDVQIDMVYFDPHLARVDGGAIGALTTQPLEGRTWQRWSRHRTSENPWRREEDCVETHLFLVNEWLAREIRKAA
jgi:hypothetical protein